MTGPSVNNNYNNILAELGWPIKNGELSSQLAGQQWVKSLKGLIEWCESNFPTCLEQSALFWHQAVGYSVGKIDVFWKTFDKVRGKIEKNCHN